MSNYTVLVTSAPYDDQGASTALAFCHQLLADGHHIDQIFFYQRGIYNAMPAMAPPNDETNYFTAWKTLNQNHNVTLRVCMTAGEKRGINANDIVPFEQTGLGEFFADLHNSKHLVQF